MRRLFTDPVTGMVTDIDATRRRFTPTDARFLDARDQHCRHPGCHGAIADHDHVVRRSDRGPTTRTNGQGLCEAHNLVKEIPGWTTRVVDPRPGRHTVEDHHPHRPHLPIPSTTRPATAGVTWRQLRGSELGDPPLSCRKPNTG